MTEDQLKELYECGANCAGYTDANTWYEIAEVRNLQLTEERNDEEYEEYRRHREAMNRHNESGYWSYD